MNAQLNSTNFQQFVKDNQGKKITFIHNDNLVSKVVVDVCGEYFTGKNQESDAKIDGFYYFSACKMFESKHPLVEVLEKQHNVVTLHFINGMSSIFKFDEYNRNMINGTCLTTSHPLGFHPDSVKEAWSIIYGKYTKVWEKDPIILEEILKNKQEYKLTVEHADKFLELKEELWTYSPLYAPDFIYTLLQIKFKPEFSLERLNKFQKAWDCLKESLKIQMKYFKEPKVQSFLKPFFETTILISPDNENCKEVLEKINNIIKQYKEEQKNIKYRGKPKTVVVMNEFTHPNGKEYVMVKDITDNNKTKTLFKEYIEWM